MNLLDEKRLRVTELIRKILPRWTVVQGKAAKTAYLNTVSGGQRLTHLLNQTFNRQFHILMVKMTVLGCEYFD